MTSLSKLLSRDVFSDPLAALPAQSSLTNLTAGMRASLGRRSSTRRSGILDDVRTSSRIPDQTLPQKITTNSKGTHLFNFELRGHL